MQKFSNTEEFKKALETHAPTYEVDLTPGTIRRLSQYYTLLNRWNPRLHLVAPSSPLEFARRHVLESLLLLRHLPSEARVADVGSGAGLPIIPCIIVRPDITATLIESSKKKAVFLREALNHAEVSESATVIADRFEDISAPEVDYITCRALDRFEGKLPDLLKWSPPATILLFFGGEGLRDQIMNLDLSFDEFRIPNSKKRYLYVIKGK
ncbi:hypothetical protein BH18ACI4_BH18ACI4_16700 [soil metagenome]